MASDRNDQQAATGKVQFQIVLRHVNDGHLENLGPYDTENEAWEAVRDALNTSGWAADPMPVQVRPWRNVEQVATRAE